jgi:hypothetical protein
LIKYIIPIIAGIGFAAPALAQNANHVRVGTQLYDIRTGSSIDGIALRGPSQTGLDAVRLALVEAGCLRPDETDLSRHDCYINQDGRPVHRPARDNNGRPQGATALCRDGTYSFSQHHDGTCSHHGGVEHWEEQPRVYGGPGIYTPGEIDCYRNAQQGIFNPACSATQPRAR